MPRIFADLDGTITESRQKISPKVKRALSKLDVVVISGASRKQMEYQLDGLPCTILAQSGNDTPLWKNKLTKEEKSEIKKHISNFKVKSKDCIEDRGCQMSFSFIGHHAPIDLKKKYDPNRVIRTALLKACPFKSKTLVCKVAGTTCFDYTHKNGTKGKNIARWIKENKLNKKDCVYFGDALFKGGNDESVVGIIRTVAVANPTDLVLRLKQYVY